MVVATACFAGLGIFVRHLSPQLHPFEIAFLRNLLGFLIYSPLFFRSGKQVLHTERLGQHALRAVLTTIGMSLSFLAFSVLPQAEATALSFSDLIFSSLLAMTILKEPMGWERWGALGLGILGTLVVLRPGAEAISPGAIWTLFSAMALAGSIIFLKILSRTESSLTITAYMGLFQTPLTLVAALWVWQWPTLEQLLWLLAMGIVGNSGHLALALAFKSADATTLLPLGFVRLIWASLLGFWIFGEVPQIWIWIGGGLIFVGGILPGVIEARRSAAPQISPQTE